MRGDRLKEIRELRQISQRELASACGLGEKQIWRYENGKNDPEADTLARIAKELDVTADYLLGLVDDPRERLEEEELSPTERKLLSAYRRGDLKELFRVATNDKDS